MSIQSEPPSGGLSSHTPPTVSRGVSLQLAYLGLDSLYLVVEYPSEDVFKFWASEIAYDLDNPDLFQGVPYGDFLIRRGALGYSLSAWDGDARLFLTDRVSDNGGRGMGLMLQLGPKWLTQFGDIVAPNGFRQNIEAQLRYFHVKDPLDYPVRINRLDLNADLLGLRIADFSIDDWRDQWVGYSKLSNVFFSRRTGVLEGLSVGSSTGAVRFKAYDKVAESLTRQNEAFWRAVWGVEPDAEIDVTRFEWTFKCFQGGFQGMRYLSEMTFEGVLDLLNYATLKWGRLCVPQPDTNSARWPLAPLWVELRSLIDAWTWDYDGIAERVYEHSPDITYAYKKNLLGHLAGLQARVSLVKGKEGPVSVKDALGYLEACGDMTAEGMHKKANNKLQVLARLAKSKLAEEEKRKAAGKGADHE